MSILWQWFAEEGIFYIRRVYGVEIFGGHLSRWKLSAAIVLTMRERTLPLVGGFLSNPGYDRHNCALTKKHLVLDYEAKCFFGGTKRTRMRAVP